MGPGGLGLQKATVCFLVDKIFIQKGLLEQTNINKTSTRPLVNTLPVELIWSKYRSSEGTCLFSQNELKTL
jgi:hypothetical protein